MKSRRPSHRRTGKNSGQPSQRSHRDQPSLQRDAAIDSGNSRMTRQRDRTGPRGRDPIAAVVTRSPIQHPLIYRKRILDTGNAAPGDLVAVYAEGQQQPYAYGLFNPRSELSLRLLWTGAEFPDEQAWQNRLLQAVKLRTEFLRLQDSCSAFRLVHAEADGLSGLVVDWFNGVLSAEAFSLGMYQRAAVLMPMLAELTQAEHWMLRPSPQFLAQEGCDPPVLATENFPQQVIVQEYGTRFRIRFAGSHKTGFFCDQRENRRMLSTVCAGRSVLDLCCYTGGFSVSAALGGAAEVTGVDIDDVPLQVARENANLNQASARFVQADIFTWMREMMRNGRQYDVVILDPPKLIPSRRDLEDGTKKHFAMNRLAMRMVRPGGLLLTCSCAGLLPEPEFLRLLSAAARSGGEDFVELGVSPEPRSFQIIARSGAAPDHPVASGCPESEYLKAAWLVVH